MQAQPLIEVWRGDLLECLHVGHAVVCNSDGEVVQSWGDPGALIYPRSACKMIQALPLIESGAADAVGLTSEQLALSCASHIASDIHTSRVSRWLADLGLGESDLRCGNQEPGDIDARDVLIRKGEQPCQIHNNCSGKHSGFLTYSRHVNAGPEYVEVDHPLQIAVRAAFEETTGETSPCFGIDGCSAPNFATSVTGLARAMAKFATAGNRGGTRDQAMTRLVAAMMKHPELISGEGKACTELMRAAQGKAAIKGGADGVYTAILPREGLGVALKIVDGNGAAREGAIAALLIHLGVLQAGDPIAAQWINRKMTNRRGLTTGILRAAPGFPA